MTEIEKAWAAYIAADNAYGRDESDNPEIKAAADAAGVAYFSIKQDGDTPLWAEWRLKMVDFFKTSDGIEATHLWRSAEAAYAAAYLADGLGIMPPDLENQGTQQ